MKIHEAFLLWTAEAILSFRYDKKWNYLSTPVNILMFKESL